MRVVVSCTQIEVALPLPHCCIAQDDHCTWTIQSCWLVTPCDSCLAYHQLLLVPLPLASPWNPQRRSPRLQRAVTMTLKFRRLRSLKAELVLPATSALGSKTRIERDERCVNFSDYFLPIPFSCIMKFRNTVSNTSSSSSSNTDAAQNADSHTDTHADTV